MFWLLIAFIAVPIAEIALFITVGERLGLGPTLVIVVATAVLGAALVSRQGRSTLAQAQSQLRSGQLPGRELAHGAMILVAGAVLLTPGFLTDAVGFLLLVPAVREVIRRSVARHYSNRVTIIPGPPPSHHRPPPE